MRISPFLYLASCFLVFFAAPASESLAFHEPTFKVRFEPTMQPGTKISFYFCKPGHTQIQPSPCTNFLGQWQIKTLQKLPDEAALVTLEGIDTQSVLKLQVAQESGGLETRVEVTTNDKSEQ